MINIKVAALAMTVITLAVFAFLPPSTDSNTVKKIAAEPNEIPQASTEENNNIKISQQRLPVEHGIADENGRQVGVAPQRLRAAPSPPSSASKDDRYRKAAHHEANEHGHERNHDSPTSNENTSPAPTGANKG